MHMAQATPQDRIPRPVVVGPFRMTATERKALKTKAKAHGVVLAELLRRAVAAYPARPSVQP